MASAHELPLRDIPDSYRLRGRHEELAGVALRVHFDEVSPADRRAGDVLLLRAAADQIHFAVHCGASFIHADAKLRRIVEVPGEPPWELLGVYRQRGI